MANFTNVPEGLLRLPHVPGPADRLLHDRKEAAYLLSISVRKLDYAIAAKQIRTRRNGRRVLVPHGELLRYSRADHFDSDFEGTPKDALLSTADATCLADKCE